MQRQDEEFLLAYADIDAAYTTTHPQMLMFQDDQCDDDDDEETTLVDQMLVIVASQTDVAVPNGTLAVTRDDVKRIYRDVQGDPSRVYDDVMSLLTIRALHLEEEASMAAQERTNEAKLQWHELCGGLDLSECHEFFRLVEAMPEHERDVALSENGGFFQSLLLQLEEQDRSREDELSEEMVCKLVDGSYDALDGDARAKEEDEEHPLEQLRRMFPDYKMNVIEDVFEAHGFNVEATASALVNINAVNQVKSFASVIKNKQPTTMWKQLTSHQQQHQNHHQLQQTGDSYDALPKVESLGQFPVLPAKSKQRRHRNKAKGVQYRTLDEFSFQSLHQSQPMHVQTSTNPNVLKQRTRLPNAWNTQATPTENGTGAMETKLSTDLKLQRLFRLLPSIDREVIRTSFFLNDSSSTATEAALREIFHLPVPEPPPQPAAAQPEDDDALPVTTADSRVEANPTYAECRARVANCWHDLSDRYVAALRSFNRDHHIIANDRVRDISVGRNALRAAQHEAAHAFVTAHLQHIRRHQALDLHGLTVVEAIRVAREVIDVCRAERIRRCILITGAGNHSINQKARLLTAIQLSLEHRRIAFRKESGMLYIYPLRASS